MKIAKLLILWVNNQCFTIGNYKDNQISFLLLLEIQLKRYYITKRITKETDDLIFDKIYRFLTQVKRSLENNKLEKDNNDSHKYSKKIVRLRKLKGNNQKLFLI